jgi:hypothetical protein
MRSLILLLVLAASAYADSIGDGYLVTSNGKGDDRVVPFGVPKTKEYFDSSFLADAPHTKDLVDHSTAIEAKWNLIGYIDGNAVYDVVHAIKAHGGDWAVKTILLESDGAMYRPLFSRETQPEQWPVTASIFSITKGQLSIVDRYRENARIPGPYGHVLTATKEGWVVEDYTKHPQLFKNE